jgi:transcriptional regulator
MSLFDPRSAADVVQLVRDYPLAMLVSLGPAGFAATPLPLLLESDANGEPVALIGHFARSNPQAAALQADPKAIAIFQGPHGYVSPRIVSKPGWAPTWNYAVVRFQVELSFEPERNDEAIRALVETMEGNAPGAWTVEAVGERYERLVQHVIAFRARIIHTHATFKLGQDEDRTSFDEIVAGISDEALTRLMTGQRQGNAQ